MLVKLTLEICRDDGTLIRKTGIAGKPSDTTTSTYLELIADLLRAIFRRESR